MPQYKVKKDHLGWFGQKSTESDEHSAAVIEDLNRKLTKQLAASDAPFEGSQPGHGVWIRVAANTHPVKALSGIGRAACKQPWQQSVDDPQIDDTALVKISKVDLSGCQMDEQHIKAIFKEFFSQLRLYRPVAVLNLAGCGLTKTCSQLFSFCAVHLELTRLDISSNPEFSFKGDALYATIDLMGFTSFIRSAHLEALRMHGTGFSNQQLISMCSALATLGGLKAKLKHVSIGPPRDDMVIAERCQLHSVPFSEDCLAAVGRMLTSLPSLDLVVIYGLSAKQTEALCAAAPSTLQRDASRDDCLRLISASSEALEWAEFGPLELDARLLRHAEVHTMDDAAEAGDEHMAQQHGGDDVPAASLATAPGKLHVDVPVQQAAGPFARRLPIVQRHRQHRQPRRRPQSGGQRRVRRPAGGQVRRRKRPQPAIGAFVDEAAGEGPAREDGATGYAAPGQWSDDRFSDLSNGSQDLRDSSDGDLCSEDEYPEEDREELQAALAGAADAGALSEDSLSGQAPAHSAGSPQNDAETGWQASSPAQQRLHKRKRSADRECAAGGWAPDKAITAPGSASQGTPERGQTKKQKRSKEAEDLQPWPDENPESAEKHPPKGLFAPPKGSRRQRTRLEDWRARWPGQQHESSMSPSQRQEANKHAEASALPDTPSRRPFRRDQPQERDRPSQRDALSNSDGDSEGGQPASARPHAATQRPNLLQDSEEQEDWQQPLPGGAAQRPFLRPESEDQDGPSQPDRPEDTAQPTIELSSEEQDEHIQPGEPLPALSPIREGAEHRDAVNGGSALHAAAPDAKDRQQETVLVGDTQTREEFEHSISHLPPGKQRKLMELRVPFLFDRRRDEQPVNEAKYRPKHSKRQVRQPERFGLEGIHADDRSLDRESEAPNGHYAEADGPDASSSDDDMPLRRLMTRSENTATAITACAAGAKVSAAHTQAPGDQTREPVSVSDTHIERDLLAQQRSFPETALTQPTPAEGHAGCDLDRNTVAAHAASDRVAASAAEIQEAGQQLAQSMGSPGIVRIQPAPGGARRDYVALAAPAAVASEGPTIGAAQVHETGCQLAQPMRPSGINLTRPAPAEAHMGNHKPDTVSAAPAPGVSTVRPAQKETLGDQLMSSPELELTPSTAEACTGRDPSTNSQPADIACNGDHPVSLAIPEKIAAKIAPQGADRAAGAGLGGSSLAHAEAADTRPESFPQAACIHGQDTGGPSSAWVLSPSGDRSTSAAADQEQGAAHTGTLAISPPTPVEAVAPTQPEASSAAAINGASAVSGDKDPKLPGEAPAASAPADIEGRREVSLVLRPETHMGPVAAAEDRPDTRDSTGLISAVSSEAGEGVAAAAGDWMMELVPDSEDEA